MIWRVARFGYVGLVILGLIFLIAPLLIAIPLSFNAEPYFTFTPEMLRLDPEAYSLRWYRTLIEDPVWGRAMLNSFGIGIAATIIATFLGTLAAMGLSDPRMPMKQLLTAILLSPMVTPIIVIGIGLFYFYANLNLVQTYTGIVLAHALLGTPFVVITVTASLSGFDHNLVRAAQSLGASAGTIFRRIQLPLIAPGVISGALFAFAASFDEVVVVLFIGGVDHHTIPRVMWSGIREEISPTILAVATLLIILAVLVLLVLELIRARNRNLQRRDVRQI